MFFSVRPKWLLTTILSIAVVAALSGCGGNQKLVEVEVPLERNPENALLTDPFLQLPGETSVNVVWFTNFEGSAHKVHYGEGNSAMAATTRLARMMEDASSSQLGKNYSGLTYREVYRHEATVANLSAGERVEYSVSSTDADGFEYKSEVYTLAAEPAKGQPLKILLTSDLQSKKNVVANYQKVVATVGVPDAVFFAGDFVNVPDRASEWFDQARENSPPFFPALQGRYQQYMPGFPYNGAAILQHAPLFGTIGNHEVMGRYLPEQEGYSLGGGFNDPQPVWYAKAKYDELKATVNPSDDPAVAAQWIKDRSHNQQSFLDIFSFPADGPKGEDYYATSFGDVFVISMNVSRIWRSWSVSGTSKSKFVEDLTTLENPEQWGFGEFLFERFDRDSEQYAWLEDVLNSDEFKQAKYKVLMAHQGVFGLGDNTVPVLSQPVMQVVRTLPEGGEDVTEFTYPISAEDWTNTIAPMLSEAAEIRYQYPLAEDVWHRDIEPLLVEHGVDLVHIGHSHLWNRAEVDGLNYLESSNVGNSYGAYYVDDTGAYTADTRSSSADFWDDVNSENPRWSIDNYPPNGDPQGRTMSLPTLFSPMSAEDESYPALPFVATNNLSVFSILDTASGTVKSYVFDPSDLNGEVKLFDEFPL